jgi:TAG lipase / lysophosphatidylethanolamine acyltransferase
MASNTAHSASAVPLYAKDRSGNPTPWRVSEGTQFRHYSHGNYDSRAPPMRVAAQYFHVNHFIISQARPYLIPFERGSITAPRAPRMLQGVVSAIGGALGRLAVAQLRHWLLTLARANLLPARAQRLLLDETLTAASLVIVPFVPLRDYVRLLDPPTRANLQGWARLGEASCWPAVAALKVRCSVEVALREANQGGRRGVEGLGLLYGRVASREEIKRGKQRREAAAEKVSR